MEQKNFQYMIFANNGILMCLDKQHNRVENWALHAVNGKGVCLFVDNAYRCRVKDVRFSGITNAQYDTLVCGTFAEDSRPLWSKKEVDENGYITVTAKRKNGGIVKTILDKDGKIVKG